MKRAGAWACWQFVYYVLVPTWMLSEVCTLSPHSYGLPLCATITLCGKLKHTKNANQLALLILFLACEALRGFVVFLCMLTQQPRLGHTELFGISHLHL